MKFVNAFAVIFPVVMLVANADIESATVGQSFYLREKDISSPLIGGVHIFERFDDNCYKWETQRVTIDDRSTFENTEAFYNQIASDSKLSMNLIGMFTFGRTLSAKTQSMSSGKSDIKGVSINVVTYVNASYLNQDCFHSSKIKLTDDVINMFDSLSLTIKDPWLAQSWEPYEIFLKTFGSHFVTKTNLGVAVRQWTFSKAESDYSSNELNIRACLNLAGPTDVGELDVSACRDVTKAKADNVTHLETSNYLEIHGGSDETRHRFRASRNQNDLNQLLDEGQAMQSPTSNEYMAIWDILMMEYYDNPTRYAKAMNLMQYYHGYKDFGCSLIKDGDRKLRAFEQSEDSIQELPVFECNLIKEGCHSNKDCHEGIAGSVTYCYGPSCYEYKTPAFGSKAKSVIVRSSRSESYRSGVNLSCYYKNGIRGACSNHFHDTVIWSGEEEAQLVMPARSVAGCYVMGGQNDGDPGCEAPGPQAAAVGQSFYLREKDISSPLIGGVHIFERFDDNCYKWETQRVTIDDRSTFENTEAFYNQIASDSKLSMNLIGMFTFGRTLSAKTQSMSSGKSDIKGVSINVVTYVNASYLDQDCFHSSKSQLTDDVINMFDSLSLTIKNPWLSQSWEPYEIFLKTFGSHFVTKTNFGVAVRQWTFSKAESDYSSNELNIRACLNLAGPTDVGELDVSACRDVTKAKADNVTHLETSNYLEIHGGSDETRHRFRASRNQNDLNQLLDEGQAMQSPTSNEYMAIWDILKMKYYDNSTRYAKAMNLMQYYHGYKDFGCVLLKDGDRKLRAFEQNDDSTQELPVFKCRLIKEGCHSNKDCHIGGAGSVTYCYGNSCYEYKTPAFGSKAKSVLVRKSKSESFKSGVNKSCHYKFGVKGACSNHFKDTVIWSGEEEVQ